MQHGRDWRTWILVLGHGGLLVPACGIAQRRVQERDDVVEAGGNGLRGNGAWTAAGTRSAAGGGAHSSTAGAGARSAAGGVGGNGDVTHGSGVELNPVGVGGEPTEPCACGTCCVVEQCTAVSLANPGYSTTTGSVVDSAYYYIASGLGLWRVERDARAPMLVGAGTAGAKLLATFEPYKRSLTQLTVDSQDVYWAAPPGTVPAQLKRTPKVGGASFILARLPNDEDWPLGLAVDDSDLYFTSNAALQRVAKAGGAVSVLEPIGAHVGYADPIRRLDIALDETGIYFDADRTLRRRLKSGNDSASLYDVPDDDELRGVVLDAHYAYFGTKSGNVFRVLKLGGEPCLMVSGEQNPYVTAVDSTSVYWVVPGQPGRLRMAPK